MDDSKGRHWSYEEGTLDPHRYDYKRRVDDDAVERVLSLLSQENATQLSFRQVVHRLRDSSQLCSYDDSSVKKGCFIQASCVVTAESQPGELPWVLVQRRAEGQFHAPEIKRNLSGGACLIGTVAGRLSMLDERGDISNDIFSQMRASRFNPLALFGRKLLVPAPQVRSRFLGLGYNLAQWAIDGKAYLHLIWQVVVPRREMLAPAMIVPERASAKHDVLEPQAFEQAVALMSESARIDRSALEAIGSVNLRQTRFGDETAGLIPASTFSSFEPATAEWPRFLRDAVIFDLLRMFQTAVHRGQVRLSGTNEDAFRADLAHYLLVVSRGLPYHLVVNRNQPMGVSGGLVDLWVGVWPAGAGRRPDRPHLEYMIECKVSSDVRFNRRHVQQCRGYSLHLRPASPVDEGGCSDCVILVQGVRGVGNTYAMGGIEVVDRREKIYGLRVALDPKPPSKQQATVGVAHGLLPVRVGDSSGLVIVHPHSKGPRLPGGRLDLGQRIGDKHYSGVSEQPEAGLRRELQEELGLSASMIDELVPIRPLPREDVDNSVSSEPYFVSEKISQRTGRPTIYRFHPFLVTLNEIGVETLRQQLAEGHSREEATTLRVVSTSTWKQTGLGFDPAYARQLLSAVRQEDLESAAFSVERSELAFNMDSTERRRAK